jgi:hypothetical protein
VVHLRADGVDVRPLARVERPDLLDLLGLVLGVAVDVLAGEDVVPRLDDRPGVPLVDVRQQPRLRVRNARALRLPGEPQPVVTLLERLETRCHQGEVFLELVPVLREDERVDLPHREGRQDVRAGRDVEEGVLVRDRIARGRCEQSASGAVLR